MHRKILLSLVAACLVTVLHAQADGDSAKYRSRMLAVGAANVLDTYLSPEKYKGVELRIISQTRKPWRGLVQTIVSEGSFAFVSNRADNNDELGGRYDFQYHLRRGWQLAENWRVEAGGGVEAALGVLYNTRNNNNPVQAQAALSLNPSMATDFRFQLLKRPSILRYEVIAPLVGLMFSPNYGQSYYEIFGRGDYDHNIVPTTIVSTPSLRHLLTLDFPISRRKPENKLRIGYLGDYRQAEVNNLKFHHYSHLIVIGWTKVF